MTIPTLWIRADANPKIGLGHLMRCFALAQAWRDLGGAVTFVLSAAVPAIASRFDAEGIRTVVLGEEPGSAADLVATASILRKEGAERVVLDGYHFSSEFQQAIRDTGALLMTIDDNGEVGRYVSEWVFNQNLHAHKSIYPASAPYTEFLLGPQHVLLRRDFVTKGAPPREIAPRAQRLLVTLGGGDHDNVTEMVLHALDKLSGPLEIRVVVGAANPHLLRLREIIPGLRHEAELLCNVEDMRSLMLWADLAVTGAGSTCWEACFLGLPFATVVVADNQVAIAEQLDTRGAAKNLGWHTALTHAGLAETIDSLVSNASRRRSMSEIARTLIDGQGAMRTAKAILAGARAGGSA